MSVRHTEEGARRPGADIPPAGLPFPALRASGSNTLPKRDAGRRTKVILRKFVVLELEEAGSKEFQLYRPECKVSCYLVISPPAECPGKVCLLSACVQTSRRLRALHQQDAGKGSGASRGRKQTRTQEVVGLRSPQANANDIVVAIACTGLPQNPEPLAATVLVGKTRTSRPRAGFRFPDRWSMIRHARRNNRGTHQAS